MSTDTGSGTTREGADLVERLLQVAGRREEPPRADYERVFAAATAALRRKRARRRSLRAFGLAAALLVGVAALWRLVPVPAPVVTTAAERIVGAALVLAPGDESWRPLRVADGALGAGTAVRTAAGGRVALRLAGGESLRVDERSEIVVAAADRVELRSGAVYVDSGARDAGAGAVEIVTALGTARDVGTQFQVRVGLDALRVWVREGMVTLRYGAQSASAAGEALTLWSSGQLERADLRRDDPGWRWIETVAVAPAIDDRPLDAVLAWIGRETGREIRYSSAEVERRARAVILHGSIRDLDPLEALEAALATTDLEYTLLPDGSILIRPR